MAFDITGRVHAIMETKQFSEKFSKREFVVEIMDNPKYPQLVSFEATKDRISQLDGLAVGDSVKVAFNLRGREWRPPGGGDAKFFTTLEAWRIEKAASSQPATGSAQSRQATTSYGGNAPGDDQDIPF